MPTANDGVTIAETSMSLTEIATGDDYAYQFLPTCLSGTTWITFQVQAQAEAHVLLSSHPSEQSGASVYETVLGGWGNTQSVIRKAKQGMPSESASTPGVLSEEELRWFWVSWGGGRISAGVGSSVGQGELLAYADPSPSPVNYVAFATGWGSMGQWRIPVGLPTLGTFFYSLSYS